MTCASLHRDNKTPAAIGNKIIFSSPLWTDVIGFRFVSCLSCPLPVYGRWLRAKDTCSEIYFKTPRLQNLILFHLLIFNWGKKKLYKDKKNPLVKKKRFMFKYPCQIAVLFSPQKRSSEKFQHFFFSCPAHSLE